MTLVLSKNCCDCQDVYDDDLGPCDDCDDPCPSPCPVLEPSYSVEFAIWTTNGAHLAMWDPDCLDPAKCCTQDFTVWDGASVTYRPVSEGTATMAPPTPGGWNYATTVSTGETFTSCDSSTTFTPGPTLNWNMGSFTGAPCGRWVFNMSFGNLYIPQCDPRGVWSAFSGFYHTIIEIT